MRRAWVVGSLAVLACSSSDAPSPMPAAAQPLSAGIVASVGSVSIPATTVSAIARAQQVPPSKALANEIRDTLFASGAEGQRLERTSAVQAALRGALARVELEAIMREASEADPTDAEVAEATARHFVELDRPEAFRVVHAVVRIADDADAAAKTRARAVATRLAERVAKAHDEAEFRALAESLSDRDGFELVIDTQKAVAADGRVVDLEHPSSGETYVAAFARAAARLGQPGLKSGVVPTEYGFHVMMLLERTPAHAVPLDERRRLLRDEIVTDRARRMKKELLQRIRTNVSTSVERSADALLSTVDVGGHENP